MNSWQHYNAQIPASAFFWKNTSCYELKNPISKPLTNILEIPLSPWHATTHRSDFNWGFFSLPWNADNPINAISSVPEKSENWGCDCNNSPTGLWMKCLLDEEITLNRAGFRNNNRATMWSHIIVDLCILWNKQQHCALTFHSSYLVT